MVEDDAPVLRAFIGSLFIQGGGVMGFPEHFQQFVEGYFGLVVNDIKTFCMARCLCADLLICWVFYMATAVTAGYFVDPI